MSKKEVVTTIYGKFSKFDIVKEAGGVFGNPKFYIYKDGKYYRGSFSRLDAAVQAAEAET